MDIQQKHQQFEQSYPELFDYTYRYVRFRIYHTQEAEDLVADIFRMAYEKLDDFDEERGNLRQWITGIMRNKVVEYWRSRKINLPLEDVETTLLSFINKHALEEQLDGDAFFEQLMEHLSLEQKALFTLRYVDGLTYEEIARQVKKQPGAIRNVFSRLHRKLRYFFSNTSQERLDESRMSSSQLYK